MVFGVLDRGNETVPGVARPVVTLELGGGGGFGGLAPDIGPFSSGPGLEDGLLSLEIARGFAPVVDWAELLLTPIEGAGEMPALGDTGQVVISVGDHSAAFACTVDLLEHRADGSVRLGLGNGSRVLAQSRLSAAFNDMTPGDVIADLCGQVGVDVGAVSGGDTMARYVVENSVSLLDQIAQLAISAGRLAWFGDDGALVLLDDSSDDEELVLSAGDALIDSHLSERASSGAIRITGAGASDPLWLRKDISPLQAEAGSTPPERAARAPWQRSVGGVQSMAEARGRAFARDAGIGRILLAGYPDVLPGRVVKLEGTALDGAWRVMSSSTRFDANHGYSHQAQIARESDGAGAPGLGGLL